MSRPLDDGARAPHPPRSPSTSTRAQLWAPSEWKQLLVSAVVLLGPGLLGAMIMGLTGLADHGPRGLFDGLVGGGLVGVIVGGIPLATVALLVHLAVRSRVPKRWFHDLTHELEIEHDRPVARVLLRDPRGALLGDTGARTLFVQKDNVLRHLGKHRVLAGALLLVTPDRHGVRVVGRTVVAPWPGLPAEATDFREVDDDVFLALQSL